MKAIALKVDVDTYDGMQKGVPQFLRLFKALDISASFFIPFGPDASGKAILRVFKKKGFLQKMLRTNPVKLYGFKTLLRGTLLPAPLIGASFPHLARQVLQDGHELGIHGYNHVYWQDHLLELSLSQVQHELARAVESYQRCLGFAPRSFAAPAWLCETNSLTALDALNLDYVANSRGYYPYYPVFNGQTFKTLEFPSTLPTLDELLGRENLKADSAHAYLTQQMIKNPLPLHVHTIHTEVEALFAFDAFAQWLKDLKNQGYTFVRLGDWAQKIKSDPIATCPMVLDYLPGRSGVVSCQKI